MKVEFYKSEAWYDVTDDQFERLQKLFKEIQSNPKNKWIIKEHGEPELLFSLQKLDLKATGEMQ